MSISVCIAAFNGAHYIREQVVSILPQLCGKDEVVVVDDASSDKTALIVESIRDHRIRMVRHARNCGVIATFERAVREAAGDILFLSDQDDIWHAEKVATMMQAFAADARTTLVLTNGDLIDGNGQSLGQPLNAHGRFSPGVLANLIRNRYQGSTMAFRREILAAALPFPDDIPMHDSWIGLVNAVVGRTVYLPARLMLYRRHDSNVTAGEHGTVKRMAADRWHLAKNLICRSKTLARVRRELRQRTAVTLDEEASGPLNT